MRDELSALYLLLNKFITRTGFDPEADGFILIARVCSGLEATLDAHLQRIEQLERRTRRTGRRTERSPRPAQPA